MRARFRLMIVLALLAATVLLPAAAGANAISEVKAAFQRQGTIRACQFPVKTLAAAKNEEDSYDAEYFQDLTIAISEAINAAGSCGQQTSGKVHLVTLPPLPRGALPASVTASSRSALPAPIVAALAVVLLLILGAALIGLFRFAGWEPAWLLDWRQAWAEMSARFELWWASLGDRRRQRAR